MPSPHTHPPGQKVKAEFVFTGAQVNDALQTKGRGRVSSSSKAPEEPTDSRVGTKPPSCHPSLPLFKLGTHYASFPTPSKYHLWQEPSQHSTWKVSLLLEVPCLFPALPYPLKTTQFLPHAPGIRIQLPAES